MSIETKNKKMIHNAKQLLDYIHQEIIKHEEALAHLKKMEEPAKALALMGEAASSTDLNALIKDFKPSGESSVNNRETLDVKSLLKDYPIKGRFVDKIKFLSNLFPNAWRTSDIAELITSCEGPNPRTLKSFSQKVKNLVYSGDLIGAKYSNSNKYTFFLLPEWRTNDKKPNIKPEHAPLDFGNLPVEKRKPENIEWLETKK